MTRGELRRVFEDPDSFSPILESEKVTQEVARRIGTIADTLRPRHGNPQVAAHFLMKCMFCLFAEDVGLLPKDLFLTLIEKCQHQPHELTRRMTDLFEKMRLGGDFGTDTIPWFDGGKGWYDNMWRINPEETIEFMKTVEKPWIAFKVLAAGAIPPRDGFAHAFDNGADFIAVGMFDFQVKEDCDLARAAIARAQTRPRPWRARSHGTRNRRTLRRFR